MKDKKRKGFTLTEVLVVVLIISVIAAIVYPLYSKTIVKSRAAEAINLLEMVRNKQLQKFARDGEYFTDLSSAGKFTNSGNQEFLPSGGMKINDYTLKLNDNAKCVSAAYEKGSIKFTFSSSYENAGLGCTGTVCSSFGDIVGTTEEVCAQEEHTPVLSCSGSASESCGKCGTKHRVCNTVSGVWGEYGACTGEGSCSPGETLNCEGGGIQTCGSSCSWGACESIACSGEASRGCGRCGTQTRSCNSFTKEWGDWGACSGQGECLAGAGSGKSCLGDKTGTQWRTCSSTCMWSEWDTSGCIPKTACSECPSGSDRDFNIKFKEDGDCCISTNIPCPADCSVAPNGYIRTGAEFANPDGSGCCADACWLEHGKNTCDCWSYAQSGENVCKCLGVGPYNFADSASLADKCTCDSYFSSNKRDCCKELGGSYNGSAQTCSAPVYEWKIVHNSEIWLNAYSCPSQEIIPSICNAVLTNSYYFTNPDMDNLPICGKTCSKSQLGKKCKYCEVAYDRVCPGFSSGGGPSVIKKTKTCVEGNKNMF